MFSCDLWVGRGGEEEEILFGRRRNRGEEELIQIQLNLKFSFYKFLLVVTNNNFLSSYVFEYVTVLVLGNEAPNGQNTKRNCTVPFG